MAEVVRFNNEEGPTRLEVEKIIQEVQNLMQLLKDKRIYTEEELKEILKLNEDHYEN